MRRVAGVHCIAVIGSAVSGTRPSHTGSAEADPQPALGGPLFETCEGAIGGDDRSRGYHDSGPGCISTLLCAILAGSLASPTVIESSLPRCEMTGRLAAFSVSPLAACVHRKACAARE